MNCALEVLVILYVLDVRVYRRDEMNPIPVWAPSVLKAKKHTLGLDYAFNIAWATEAQREILNFSISGPACLERSAAFCFQIKAFPMGSALLITASHGSVRFKLLAVFFFAARLSFPLFFFFFVIFGVQRCPRAALTNLYSTLICLGS